MGSIWYTNSAREVFAQSIGPAMLARNLVAHLPLVFEDLIKLFYDLAPAG
jgi:hypothetical protein